MTVNLESGSITYPGNGATTAFSFNFSVPNAASIHVFTEDAAGNVTEKPSDSFEVVLNPLVDPNPTVVGGVVNYPLTGSPLPVGAGITIVRELDAVQLVSISNQSIIYPPVIEREFDYLTMLAQAGTDSFSRAFSVGITDPPPAVVPPVALRANTQAVFDANGDLTAGGPTSGSGAIISPAMLPVVTAPDLPAARTAMGVPPTNSPDFTGNPQAPTPPFGDNDRSIATTAYVLAQLAGVGAIFTTGDLKPTHKTTADGGWILWVDGTIGDVLSNSSIRANADTVNLFTLYYNSYTDANCPIRTSANAVTNRAAQGTAAAAYAAHCRLTLPRGSGRKIGIAGGGAGLSAHTIGSFQGTETVSMTADQMPNHAHNISWAGQTNTFVTPGSGAVLDNSTGAQDYGLLGVPLVTDGQGGGQPMNIMNPCTYLNIMIKL